MGIDGPRRWWAGPLDVEGLARDSVAAVIEGAEELGRARGSHVPLSSSSAAVAAAFTSINHLRIDGRAPAAFAPLSGFFPTADGWLRTHGNYPHHAAALRRGLALPPGSEDIAGALRGTDTEAAVKAIREAGGACAPALTPEQWRAHPARGKPRAPFSRRGFAATFPAGLRRSAWSLPGDARPLDGVKVVSLTRVIAGPVAARTLAALGADVLRIDPPQLPELPDQHLDTDFGVRVETRDLAEGIDELLDSADALLTGYRPDSLSRFGLDPATLRERHPHLAHAWLRAWDPEGSWALERGFDSLVQAASGIGTIYGEGERPGALPAQALDHSTGYRMAAAICRQLARGERASDGFALADAAEELLARPTPPGAVPGQLDASLRETCSPHGVLRYVPPPFRARGEQWDYPFPPE